MKSEYESPWSVAHQFNVTISDDDNRTKNLGPFAARIGRDIEIVYTGKNPTMPLEEYEE